MARKRHNQRGKVMTERVLRFENIAEMAGYLPDANGKLNLPATQETADKLAKAAGDVFAEWEPNHDRVSLTLTGAGPVWGYLCIAHALHGRVAKLTYAAPNATVVVFSHGA
jgi:hypothetical protein